MHHRVEPYHNGIKPPPPPPMEYRGRDIYDDEDDENEENRYHRKLTCVTFSYQDVLYGGMVFTVIVVMIWYLYSWNFSKKDHLYDSVSIQNLESNAVLVADSIVTMNFENEKIRIARVSRGQPVGPKSFHGHTWYCFPSSKEDDLYQLNSQYIYQTVSCVFEIEERQWSQPGHCVAVDPQRKEVEHQVIALTIRNDFGALVKLWPHVWGSDPETHATMMKSVVPVVSRFSSLANQHQMFLA